MDKPFSQACENNKAPILSVLKTYFAEASSVLEIGSGTGQHAVYFAKHLSHLKWHTSDIQTNHSSIKQWIADYPSANLVAPVSFMIGIDPWPKVRFDAVYSANTAHIMQTAEVQQMMHMISHSLPMGGVFCQYGPFTQKGEFSSESNIAFNAQLKANGYGGIRDIAQLEAWATELKLLSIVEMPANNLLLIWRRC